MEDRLLEEIAEMSYKTCLSDLHSVSAQNLIIAINHIVKSKYSLEDWNYALTYICKCKVVLHDLGEIDSVLKKFK